LLRSVESTFKILDEAFVDYKIVACIKKALCQSRSAAERALYADSELNTANEQGRASASKS
jgi:hypothetical protein